MGFYLVQVGYTDSAVKAMIERPQPREEALKTACESLGGKLHSFFFSFGDYDVALIAEFPSNDAVAALILSAASTGVLSRTHTTVLMTPAEAVKAMKKAGKAAYVPPK